MLEERIVDANATAMDTTLNGRAAVNGIPYQVNAGVVEMRLEEK